MLPKTRDERWVLGLDVGIASIGWAILCFAANGHRIINAGVYCFDTPEEGKGAQRQSKKSRHGQMKRRRRLLQRRAERMQNVRTLLHREGLLPDSRSHALGEAARRCTSAIKSAIETAHRYTPWELRKAGLSRQLTKDEFAVVLGHIAAHRAYQSNSKRLSNQPPDSKSKKDSASPAEEADESISERDNKEEQRVLAALEANEERYNQALLEGKVTTVGEWLSGFERQRNQANDYRFSIQRAWLKDEVAVLFGRQRRFGNDAAHEGLREEFAQIAFYPGQVKTLPVRECTFESGQDCAARHSYSFELFRLLARLNNLRIVSGEASSRSLDASEIDQIAGLLGLQRQITYKTLRTELKLAKGAIFDRVGDEKEDIVSRSGECAPGIRALRHVVTDHAEDAGWEALVAERTTLDQIAASIAHQADISIIRERLETLDLKADLVDRLVKEADGGKLGFFKGTGHLSNLALRKLEPHLLSGFDYHHAQIRAGYDPGKDRHSRKPGIVGTGPKAIRQWLTKPQIEELISSQTASRAVRQTFKQVLAILAAYPQVSAIHLEMAREVGKGIKKRRDIEKDQRKRERERVSLRESFQSMFKGDPSERDEDRWELWNQQKGKCAFTGDDMHCNLVPDGHQELQVEHILPRSRFRLEAMSNKVLCLASANQNKGAFTPYEWMTQGRPPSGLTWDTFKMRSQAMFKGKALKGKLRNLLTVSTEKLEQAFSNRDLNDTRWIAKFLLFGLQKLGTESQPIDVLPVNAGLVGMLRHAWGLNAWKRDPEDASRRRPDDRHHAIDAAVVATIDRKLVQDLTLAYQKAEEREDYFAARGFRQPWKGFYSELINAVYGSGASESGPSKFVTDPKKGTFVVRQETRRTRGRVHKENFYSVRKSGDDGERAFEFVSLADFESKHLKLIKDRERNGRLVRKLEDWIEAGRPMDAPPTIPYRGFEGSMVDRQIRRIRVSRALPSVRVETGDDRRVDTPKPAALQDGMPRVDVYCVRSGDSFHYEMVPIYRSAFADGIAPSLASVSGELRPLDAGAEFAFSLFKKTYVTVETTDGKSIEGYYRNFDVDSSRLAIWPHHSMEQLFKMRVSASKIKSISKIVIARLGKIEVTEGVVKLVSGEKRTWHGKVCT